MNCPCALPMDDSSAQTVSLKIWLMDEPYGRARDVIFTILSQIIHLYELFELRYHIHISVYLSSDSVLLYIDTLHKDSSKPD